MATTAPLRSKRGLFFLICALSSTEVTCIISGHDACERESWMVGPCTSLELGHNTSPTIANDTRQGNLAIGGNLYSIPSGQSPFFALRLVAVKGTCRGSISLSNPNTWPAVFSAKFDITNNSSVYVNNVAGSGGPPTNKAESRLRRSRPRSSVLMWTSIVYMPYQEQEPAGSPCEFQLFAIPLPPPVNISTGPQVVRVNHTALPTSLTFTQQLASPADILINSVSPSTHCSLTTTLRGPSNFMGDVAHWYGEISVSATPYRVPALEGFRHGAWVLAITIAGGHPEGECTVKVSRSPLPVHQAPVQFVLPLNASAADGIMRVTVPHQSPPRTYASVDVYTAEGGSCTGATLTW